METVNGITYRRVARHELMKFAKAESLGFSGNYQIRRGRLERDAAAYGTSNPLCAVDGDEFVGTCAAPDFEVGIPGGIMPMVGITGVAVSPTHRRRGILTELMRSQLRDVHRRGFAMAGLWSSEAAIYGRFGYGMAVEQQEISIDKNRATFRPTSHELARQAVVRFAGADEIRRVGPDLWKRKMRSTPGMVRRMPSDWQALYSDRNSDHDESGHVFTALCWVDGEVAGYVSYRVSNSRDDDGLSYKKLRVRELIACDPRAEASLWRFVLDVDLVFNVSHEAHPVRSNLWRMLDDPRCMEQKPYDGLWLRILDVPRALAARRYDVGGSVKIEVVDDFCEWVAGRYLLSTSSDGSAECVATDEDPDIAIPIDTLSAIYMGAHDLSSLHAAGRCTELKPGTVDRVAAMFATGHVHQVGAEF